MLLFLPIFPVAPAQSVADPWWGPVDRSNPTSGWAIRIPLTVENDLDYVLESPFVAAEIDLSRLLVEAGWTNTTSNGVVRSRGFTLDVDSIRVVQYSGGFTGGPVDGPTTKPTAHRFYPALFSGKHRVFEPTAAAGTVLFQVTGDLAPQAKRYYYVYANPTEYGDVPPATHDPLDMGGLDAFLWGTRGNVYLGYEPQQEGQSHYTVIRATAPGFTTVTVSTFESSGRFQPVTSTARQANPFLLTATQPPTEIVIPAGKPFKVEADKPIIVWGYSPESDGNVGERFGYFPGVSGSFADTEIDVFGWDRDNNVGGSGTVIRLVKAGPGTVVVDAGFQSATLTSSSPTSSITVPTGSWTRLVGTGKFLASSMARVQLSNPPSLLEIPFHTHQIPATTGGPSGTHYFNQLVNTEGFVRICPEANATIRIMQRSTNSQIYPEGTVPNVPPGVFPKEAFCQEVEVPRTAPLPGDYEMYATDEDPSAAVNTLAPFRMMVGAGVRDDDPTMNLTRPMIGHYGGLGGVDYYTYGPTGLFGHYNDTSITVFEEREKDGVTTIASYPRSLQRDSYIPITPHVDGTGRFHIVSTKPIAAVSLAPSTYTQRDSAASNDDPVTFNVPYARHVPGRPVLPSLAIGALEFRGPLVDLVSPSQPGRQVDTKTTGPGSPLEYRVDVLNLGRWVQGGRLDDTIVVSCTAPAGWTVEGCSREVRLNGGTSERLNVVVTPSLEDVGHTLPVVLEARSRSGGAVSTFTLRVAVEVRYGVGMWFDIEGGRKTMDPPVGLSPAETYRGTIVMKNTGSTEDRFTLSLEDPADGWEHALLLHDAPATEVTLAAGETVLLTYVATAPNAEQGPQNLVSITAQSQSSALAADIIYPGTRIRPKIDLEMSLTPQTQLAAPNETVVFNISTRNKGNDVFTVLFRQDSVLPLGWTATLATQEVSLNPNDTFVSQLRITPVAGARAGDLASLKLSAEVDTGGGRAAGDEVSAVVVVRRIYNLTTPPLLDAEALPGDSLVYDLPILNAGNGQVEVELLSGAVDAELLLPNGDVQPVADWVVALDDEDITLALNETLDLQVRIEVPELTPPGNYNVTFTTRLSRESVQNLTVPVHVAALSRVELEGPARIELTPGRPLVTSFVARNTGNVEAEYDLTATAPEGWNATLAPARARLAPGERVDVRLTLNATRDAANGPYEVGLASVAEGHAPTTSALRIDVARPQLYLADVAGSGDLRAGELVLVTATVGNRGGITAENVSVALTVDGRVVHRVVVARIPVGSTQIATLSWVATQRGGEVAVVLDPEQEIELASRDETERTIAFGSRVGVPGATVLVTLAAVALALLWRRR